MEGAAASGPAAVSLPEGEALDAIPPEGIELGQRAFEIVLARRMAEGEAQSTWFERHGSTPLTELPRHWPAAYRELVERRLRRIAEDPAIRLIEQPEYKRRWNTEPWDEQLQRALRDWLLARLEGYFFEGERMTAISDSLSLHRMRGEGRGEGFPGPPAVPVAAVAQPHLTPTLSPPPKGGEGEDIARLRSSFTAGQRPTLTTTNQLAEIAKTDAAFQAVAEQLMGGPGFSVPKLVRELVESASVPALPAQRYKPSGLLKREQWEEVWNLQRKEDALDAAEPAEAEHHSTPCRKKSRFASLRRIPKA